MMNNKYQDISKAVRDKIRAGIWAPGFRLPTRCELVKEYGTTVSTLQKAMDELLADGFVLSAGKSGTFVAENPPNLSTFAVVFPASPDAASGWDTFWTLLSSRKRQFEERFGLRFRFYYLAGDDPACPDLKRLVGDAAAQRLAGVVFPHPPCEFMVADLLAAGMPCVAVTRDRLPGVNTVWVDYGSFLRQAFDLLVEQGCRRIAVIANVRLPVDHITQLAEYAAAQGRELPPEWRLGVSIEHDSDFWGANLVRLLMKAPESARPDGLIVANENLGDLVTDTLTGLGVRTERDIRIVQHANFPVARRRLPGVTRIGFDVEVILECCLEALRRQRCTGEVIHSMLIPAGCEAELY